MSVPLIIGTVSVLTILAAMTWTCLQVNRIRDKHPRR